MMAVLIGFGILLLACDIGDSWRNGMLSNKSDWSVLASVLLSLCGIGAAAYWIAGTITASNRASTAIGTFFVGVLMVQVVINAAVKRQQRQRMKVNGVLTDREWNRRVDELLEKASGKH